MFISRFCGNFDMKMNRFRWLYEKLRFCPWNFKYFTTSSSNRCIFPVKSIFHRCIFHRSFSEEWASKCMLSPVCVMIKMNRILWSQEKTELQELSQFISRFYEDRTDWQRLMRSCASKFKMYFNLFCIRV